MGNTDRDVAGRLAARIDAPLVANALDVSTDPTVTISSEINGGTLGITTEVTRSGPAILTISDRGDSACTSSGRSWTR